MKTIKSFVCIVLGIILITSVVVFPLCVKDQFVQVNFLTRSVFDGISGEDVTIALQNNLTNEYSSPSADEQPALAQAMEDFKVWFAILSLDAIFHRAGWDHRIMVKANGAIDGYIITDTYIEVGNFLFYGNTRRIMAFFE